MSSSSPPDAPTAASLLASQAPYRGLTPYSERDAPLFFGRETEREIVIANLMASRLTLLYGASGVGKTSLLRAGVAHELLASASRNVADYGAPEFVAVYFNRWSDDPLTGLTRCIHESARPFLGEVEEPEIGSRGLAETIDGWTRILDADLLIILDQFEEYFLYHPDDGGEGSFAVEFPRAVERADLRVSFLVAIREDALARLDRFKGRIPNLFDNYLRTRHLDAAAARAAIEKPLEAYNRLVAADEPFTAEPELVQMVLDQVQIGKVVLGAVGRGVVEKSTDQDVTGQQIETPYLQLVLTRLWREEVGAGSHTLRAETLRRLGGAQQIVHTHLDEALRALPARQQDVAAGIFHHLVTPSGTKIAHTAPDLADYAQLPQAEVISVLERLSRADVRILRPVPPPSGQPDADPAYEIFHDVLAPAILDWWTRHTEARAAEARLGARLERSAEETRAAQERAHRYRQWLRRVSVVAMALLLILVSAVAVLAVRERNTARRAQRSSLSRELAAVAVTRLTSNPASSLGLALDALQNDSTPQAESALRRALSEPWARVLRGHHDWVMSATFSDDGRSVLTASLDNTVRTWSAATGRQLAVLRTGTPPYHLSGQPRFNRDGNLVLVTSKDGRVRVWPWRTGGRPAVISRGQEAYRAAFDPKGDHVVTGHDDGTTRVWAWRTGRPPVVLQPRGQGEVTAVAFSPDGEFVATGGEDGTVVLWPWRPPGRPMLLRGHKGWVSAVAFSPDGHLLLSASKDGTARVFAVPDGRPVATLGSNANAVNSAAFSRDGKLVVTAGTDKTVRVFAVPGGQPVATLRAPADELKDAAFSPDGKLVAAASADGTTALWHVSTGGAPIMLRGHAGTVFSVAFSPDGKAMVTASTDGTARLWQLPPRQVFAGHRGPVNAATYSPDGQHVATAGDDGTVRVYQAATGNQVAVLGAHDRAVNSATFSPDGRLIVTAGLTADNKGIVRIWDLAAPDKSNEIARELDEVDSAEFSQDGRLVVTSTRHEAVIWDTQTGTRRIRIRLPQAEIEANPFVAASLSPDGRWMLTTQYDNKARLWNMQTRKLVRSFRHAGIVYTAAFSRDGQQVLTAGGDGTARVWNVADGRQLRVLVSPSGQLRSAAFSPDAQWVAGGAADGTVSVWDVTREQLAVVLRQHTDVVNSVIFSPNGSQILSAGDDQTAMTSACNSCRPLEELLPVARQRERLAAIGT
jgi:WD40 repeat protein